VRILARRSRHANALFRRVADHGRGGIAARLAVGTQEAQILRDEQTQREWSCLCRPLSAFETVRTGKNRQKLVGVDAIVDGSLIVVETSLNESVNKVHISFKMKTILMKGREASAKTYIADASQCAVQPCCNTLANKHA